MMVDSNCFSVTAPCLFALPAPPLPSLLAHLLVHLLTLEAIPLAVWDCLISREAGVLSTKKFSLRLFLADGLVTTSKVSLSASGCDSGGLSPFSAGGDARA